MASIEEMIRARHVQQEALLELDARIKACKEAMKNYDHLSERITTLPDKISHPVMVPFGKLAFMPGKLVHTNELLVHLGDAWFTTVSCKKALEIVGTRQSNLKDTLNDLEKVSLNVKMKSEYLGDIRKAAEEQELEIKEECPANYVHPKDRRRVSRVKDKKSEKDSDASQEKQSEVENDKHKALLDRLDELERLENEEDESDRFSNDSYGENRQSTDSDDSLSPDEEKFERETTKRVTFNEDLNVVASDKPSQSCTIRFQHSHVEVKKDLSDLTPADVHRLVKQPESKSILKNNPENKTTYPVQLKTAVSDIVVETNMKLNLEPEPAARTATPSKPVSRFKAGRRK